MQTFKTPRPPFLLSLLLGSQLIAGVAVAPAGDFTLANTRDDKAVTLDQGRFDRSHIVLTADARIGYDDNTLAQPDHVTTVFVDPVTKQRQSVRQNIDTSGSVFLNFDAGIGYTVSSPRSKLSIGADVGVNYYLDRPGRDYDINGAVNLAFSYKLTPRAVLEVTSYNAYTSEPDFGASNLTNFSGSAINNVNNLSGVTSANRRSGDFFYTTDRLSLTYQFTRRISTVTSYDLVAFAYKNEPYATIQDRAEHYFSEQLRFLVSPLVTAVGEYRFGYVNYFSVRNDSIQNFVLGGADFNLSQRLRGTFRAGAQFRDYVDFNDNSVTPYVEATLGYNLSQLASLTFIARYSSEEGQITANNSSSDTLRLGVSYEQRFGARLSAYLSSYYTHASFSGPDSFLTTTNGTLVTDLNNNNIVVYPGNFTENTYDVSTGLRYSINRLLSAEVGYTHTTVDSGIDIRQYDRNRYFGGVRFSF